MSTVLHRLRLRRPLAASFCERCAEACTPACRSAAQLDRARTRAVRRLLTR